MSRIYTESTCLQKIHDAYLNGNVCRLYDEKFIKSWNGVTSDSGREYQEIFAEFIYFRLIDGKLPMVDKCKVETYCEIDRQDAIRDNEEGVQRDFFFGRRKLSAEFGIPVWFELQTNDPGQGKGIDLVYYNETTLEINIFELKYRNSTETLLRAVMEIQTYYQRVDWDKVIQALIKRGKVHSSRVAKINKYILIDKNSKKIAAKYMNISNSSSDSYVKKLLDAFKIQVIFYE